MFEKAKDKLEDKVIETSSNFYGKWRQLIENGILPIGSSGVGKTTLLSRIDLGGSNLFMNFDRTTTTKINKLKISSELVANCSGVEYIKKIDVPGDLPAEWASAYFNNNPRVLLIMVDHRDHEEHIRRLRIFIEKYKEGASFLQTVKNAVLFNWDNLSRIIFIINKCDKIDESLLNDFHLKYNAILSEIHSLFNVSIHRFKISLNDTDENLYPFFQEIIGAISRK